MKQVDIVYLYENVARELDVACAITAILRRRYGMTVRIVQWPQSVPTLYGRVVPRVVVLPFCYFEHSFDCLLEWRHAAFLNLSWEQLFYRGNVQAKTPRGRFAVSHVLHHAWSEAYAEFAREQMIPDKHVFVNGQPAYALYDEPYRGYFAQRGELALRYGLDPGKRWLFFPENYNWAFYPDQLLRFFVDAGQSADEVQEMREFCASSFRQVMRWFAGLAATGTVEVIIRPRPSTPLADFRRAVEDVLPEIPGAMHIIQGETVREWILASDVVLSSHSTSLIEAAVAGRRAYMITPIEVPTPLRQQWHDLVPRLRTEADFLATCLQSSDPNSQRPLERWARSILMSSGDAIEHLADYMARLVKGEIDRPPVPSRLCATAQGLQPQIPKWIWYIFRRSRARFRRLVPFTPDVATVREYVPMEEIERRIGRWDAVLSRAARDVNGRTA